jgi:hypothetical protein
MRTLKSNKQKGVDSKLINLKGEKGWRALEDDFRTLLFGNPGETISKPAHI